MPLDVPSAALPFPPERASLSAMTAPLPHRLARTLPMIDPARAARWRERIAAEAVVAWEAEGEGGGAFLDAAFAAAPYLARTAARRPATL